MRRIMTPVSAIPFDEWLKSTSYLFAHKLKPSAGFSVGLSDQSNEEIMKSLRSRTLGRKKDRAGHEIQRMKFAHPPTGLTIVCQYKKLVRGNGLIWSGYIENTGKSTTKHLTRLSFLDIAFDVGRSRPVLHTLNGGFNNCMFPPDAYRANDHVLYNEPTENHWLCARTIHSGPQGWSTNVHAPYFIVSDDLQKGGLFGALSWSGKWRMQFVNTQGILKIRGDIDGVDLKLKPGEKIPLPEFLLGFYKGISDDGTNALRRTLWEEFVPLINGKKPLPPVSYDQWFHFGPKFNEDVLREQVDISAELGVEYFTVDAGWFHCPKDDFGLGLGNWRKYDKKKFPSGLGTFADYVRSKGLKLGLWFEPERVALKSDLGRAHPEWLLRIPEDKNIGMLDLSITAAREWMKELFDELIPRYGIEWIRWDFNEPPAKFWEKNDLPGRLGMHQVRHVQGLYEILDHILERHDGLLMEGCAGGGRRVDLGILKRSHTFWCTDHTDYPEIVRNHQSGGSRFLPSIYFNTNVTQRTPFCDYLFHSHFGGAFGLSADLSKWTRPQRERARRHIEIFKSLRHLLRDDFYPLFPLPTAPDQSDGWQFNDPKKGEGFILLFSGENKPQKLSVSLKGLKKNARYILHDPYTGRKRILSGQQLMEKLTLRTHKNPSRLLLYAQLKQKGVRPTI